MPDSISTASSSFLPLVRGLCPCLLLSSCSCISAALAATPAGQPSISTPTLLPWLLPSTRTTNSSPNENGSARAPFLAFSTAFESPFSIFMPPASPAPQKSRGMILKRIHAYLSLPHPQSPVPQLRRPLLCGGLRAGPPSRRAAF